MSLRILTALAAFVTLVSADTLTLRSGQVIQGQYLGGDARQLRIAVGDRVDTYSIDDIASLQFGGGGQRISRADPPPDNGIREVPPQASYQPGSGAVIPTGTNITIRMIDSVDSDESRLGQTYSASVDEPVVLDGQTVIPRGSDALVKLVEDKDSGKIQGRAVLTLVLQQVTVNGRMIDLTTGDVSRSSGSRGARSAKVIGGTAALGAIIGAIAGGGRGAAIGAGSGAAVGTGVQVLTKGQRVRIPSETRLTFVVQQPAQL